MASHKPHGGAGKAPIPDVKGLPLEVAPSSSIAVAAPVVPVVAPAGAAANSGNQNNAALSYSNSIDTYICTADETDESCRENKLLAAGLTLVPIVGDGNCLFYSFERFFSIYNLPEQTKTHLQIRHEATEYLKSYSRAFLHTFQVPKKHQGAMEKLLNTFRTPANRAAKNDRAAVAHPAYLEALDALFLKEIEKNKLSGTFASGIGDIMPHCLARHYRIQVTVYDYSSYGERGFEVHKIDPSKITERPNRAHIRLERINSNHYNLLIPTVTVNKHPRVNTLVDFYRLLYYVEEAKNDLLANEGMARLAGKGEQKALAQAIVASQSDKLEALEELLEVQIVGAAPYLPKRAKKVAAAVAAVASISAVAPVSAVSAVASAAPKKKSSVAAIAVAPVAVAAANAGYKPIGSSVAAAAAPKKKAAASSVAGYKPIGSSASVSAAPKKSVSAAATVAEPPPIKKMNKKKGLKLFANLNNLSENSNNSATRKNKKAVAAPVAPAAPAATKKSSRLAPANNE